MNNSQFWKNFNLGTELGISGRFIYNGLRTFHEIDSLYHDDEVFEVLYNLAVGLERLLKIAVVLIEHDTATNQEEFERSLITHTHLDLLARVRSQHKLNLGLVHNEFLQLLGTFYNTHRYGRYSVTSVEKVSIEKHALHAFIEEVPTDQDRRRYDLRSETTALHSQISRPYDRKNRRSALRDNSERRQIGFVFIRMKCEIIQKQQRYSSARNLTLRPKRPCGARTGSLPCELQANDRARWFPAYHQAAPL